MSRPPWRTALVTGASSGLGAALARTLAREGVEVVLAARRADALARLCAEIEAAGGRAQVRALDVSDPDATARAVRELDDACSGLDLVVANAGQGGLRWAGELEWEGCASMLDVNVRGAVATLTAILPRMVARGRGQLVGVTSMAGLRALPENALYGASKAFLTSFLEGLRLDLSPVGVVVSEVRPGFVRTPMTDVLDSPKPFMLEPEAAAELVLAGLARGDAVVAFPWPIAAAMGAARALPRPIYDRLVRTVRPARGPRHGG